MHRFAFAAYGLRGHVEVADLIRARVPAYLPPGGGRTDPRSTPDATFRLAADGALTLDGEHMSDTARYPLEPAATLGNLVRWWVADNAPDHVFVAAGVWPVRVDDGLLSCTSRSGKTTLARALARAGGHVPVRRVRALDRHGRVHPYPKPLSVRTGRPLTDSVPVDEGRIDWAPARPDAVVLTWYEEGASWELRRATAGEGALGLLGHVVPFRRRPAEAMAALRSVVATAPVLMGPRGEATPRRPICSSPR